MEEEEEEERRKKKEEEERRRWKKKKTEEEDERRRGRRNFRNSPGRAGPRQGRSSLGWRTCHGTHLGPLTRPLLGAHSAAFLGVERPDEGADGGATHHVDGDPRLLHRLDHPNVGATPGWTEKIKRRMETGTPNPPCHILPRCGTHLAPPPPRTRAMVLPVRTRAKREKSLCRSALFSNTFSYISRCGCDGQWVMVMDHQGHPGGPHVPAWWGYGERRHAGDT